MKFKGNFGELTLNINGTEATGTYQENGTLYGEFMNNTFKGQWKNNGMEGLVEFKIINNKLEGSWKKGLDSGPMRGKWEGELLEIGSFKSNTDTIFESFESNVIDKVIDIDFSFDSLAESLLQQLPLIEKVANNFSEFLEYYSSKYNEEVIFWKQTKLDYAHTICMFILNEREIDFDQSFENYIRLTKTKANEVVQKYDVYFPTFDNEEDEEDSYAKYDLDELINDSNKLNEIFTDSVDYCRWHISFILYHYLSYGLDDLYEDNCEDEDSLKEFSIWVQKIVGTYWFENHSISEKIDDPWNEILSQTIRCLEILANTSTTDEDSINKEIYCEDGSEDFSAINFIEREFEF